MRISAGENVRDARNLKSGNIPLEKLADMCRSPKVGEKDGTYFIRGEARNRNDNALAEAELLIIDADKGLNGQASPPPEMVYGFLKKAGINHLIYTSYSHTDEAPKYRVVIPCKLSNKESLKVTLNALLDVMDSAGLGIARVKEMYAWSQLWFFPRLKNSDSEFKIFEYYDGKDLEGTHAEPMVLTGDEDEDEDQEGTLSRGDLRERIKQWKHNTGLHNAIRDYIWGLIKDGRSAKDAEEDARILLDTVPENSRDDQWVKYREELHRMSTTAAAMISAEGSVDIEDLEYKEASMIDLEWPPGAMGELAKSCYAFSPHPNRVVSVVTALSTIAGITGRKFNVNRTGLNIYATLLMKTGMGKNVIKDFSDAIYHKYGKLGQGASFIGPQRFTSPKAIYDALDNTRSILSVQTEAGWLFKSTAGDQAGILRMTLGLYTCSGKDQWSHKESYSSKDNSIEAMRAPALSIVNEATPSTFESAMAARDSVESGELARQILIKFIGKKSYFNEDHGNIQLSGSLAQRIERLMAECHKTQDCNDLELDNMIIDIDYDKRAYGEFSRRCVDKENDMDDEDSLKRAMVSRAALKALKVAALCAVIDGEMEVTQDQWDWARHLFDYEMSTLGLFEHDSGGSDLDAIISRYVEPVIVKMLNNGYTDKRKQMSPPLRKEGIFTYSALSQCIRNSKPVTELGYKNSAGLVVALNHLIYIGKIVEINKTKLVRMGMSANVGRAYKITQAFSSGWRRS